MKTIGFVFTSLLWLQTCRLCSAWNNPKHELSRRRAAIEVGTAAFLGTVINPLGAKAAAPVNPAEAVRRGAANIPGYGQTDVFYPGVFAGNWKAVRELQPSGLTLEYSIRFLPSIEDDAVVADRGFNQANLEQAIAQIAVQRSGDADASAAPLPSYQWVETNPNDLRIKFADGKSKDIKVTKRATEKTEDAVFSSEFQRVTQEDARGIPQITARRVISKWRVVEGSIIEGFEVVYDAGGGDPLGGTSGGGDQNRILSKSKMRLQKQ